MRPGDRIPSASKAACLGFPCPPLPPCRTTRDALEGKGPQRRPQKRLDRRLEEVAKAIGGRVLSVTNAIEAGTCHRRHSGWDWLGALEGASNGQVWTRHLAPAAPAFHGLHCLLSSLHVQLASRLFAGSQFSYPSLPGSGPGNSRLYRPGGGFPPPLPIHPCPRLYPPTHMAQWSIRAHGSQPQTLLLEGTSICLCT